MNAGEKNAVERFDSHKLEREPYRFTGPCEPSKDSPAHQHVHAGMPAIPVGYVFQESQRSVCKRWQIYLDGVVFRAIV
jgi:hypothetical protein